MNSNVSSAEVHSSHCMVIIIILLEVMTDLDRPMPGGG
jgi:hypothetical protein